MFAKHLRRVFTGRESTTCKRTTFRPSINRVGGAVADKVSGDVRTILWKLVTYCQTSLVSRGPLVFLRYLVLLPYVQC